METLPPLLEDLASQLESYLLHPEVSKNTITQRSMKYTKNIGTQSIYSNRLPAKT